MKSWFPDREFFMRSQGQVRFIKVTSKFQLVAATVLVGALLAWGLTMAAMGWTQFQAQAERTSLLQREAQVATAEERVDAYGADIESVTADLQKRQDFIDGIVEGLPADVKSGDTVSDSSAEAQDTIKKVSASVPEAAELARIEARQLLFVERLTRFADRRADLAASAIRKLGLNPDLMLRGNRKRFAAAMGGPFEKLASEADGSIDPRFARLGLSLERMSALENGLEGVPQVTPADIRMISSGFGYRRDPFNGSGAMHKGLDFRGPTGAPIHAAAKGKVTYAGYRGGYGKTIEISHGNGLMTRYAHMSRLGAKLGDPVAAGQRIGAIGSTGRSTGPHLHFEVRINNRAVNPRHFLETAPDVLEEVRAGALRARAE
ncbi:peptidoglycan DD-metalloendopeptidase family protein [Alteripontixanthobacter maritimus]|uniref:peptidoglycan DD-metalloendopeptidase family protein n=1 Tax=Alteripontixanthobacter maritimus TaxID=2161824 RepID=UPI001E3D3E07|nr:peptidoglycan DD-metalloendopeptidase family protein [Alteripontixanthobacter maritimus]